MHLPAASLILNIASLRVILSPTYSAIGLFLGNRMFAKQPTPSREDFKTDKPPVTLVVSLEIEHPFIRRDSVEVGGEYISPRNLHQSPKSLLRPGQCQHAKISSDS